MLFFQVVAGPGREKQVFILCAEFVLKLKHDAERRQRSSDWQTEAGPEVQPVKRYTNDPEKREKQKFAARLKFANNLLAHIKQKFYPCSKTRKAARSECTNP